MIRDEPHCLAELGDRLGSVAVELDCSNSFSRRSAFIDWLLKEEADLEATAKLHSFGSAAMSTSFPAQEQLRQLPAPNTELSFCASPIKCVKVGSQLGGWIPALDADWQIRRLWQWRLVLGSLLVSRLC